jgi:PEP-CTERM motif
MMIRNIAVAGLLVLSTGLSVQAQVLNPSFETVTGRIPNSWSQTGRVGFTTSAFGKTPTAGSNMLYLLGDSAVGGTLATGSIASTATVATALGSSTGALNTAAGTGHSTTTGLGAVGGSAVSQTFTVTAGSTLSFDWSFLTTEDPIFTPGNEHNDMAFVSINGTITVLGRLDELGSNATDLGAYSYIPFRNSALGNGTQAFDYLFETGNGTGTSSTRATDYNNDPLDGNFVSPSFGATRFSTFNTTFASAGSVTLGFGILNVQTTGATNGSVVSSLLVDNVVYTTGGGGGAAPEPGTLALLALGLGAAALAKRRR